MKTKLTLYVDAATIKRGKSWARRRKIPLSRVVEAHLNGLGQADAGERFLARWRHQFTLPAGIKDDPRAAAILAKHAR